MGRTDFVERHGLWDSDDAEHAARALRLIEENDLEVVRLSFADQHGLLRGKSVVADEGDLGEHLCPVCVVRRSFRV